MFVGLGFIGLYFQLCKNTINHKSQSVRLAVAGSLANMLCEVPFHIIDTINVRAKVTDQILSFKSGTIPH